MYKYFVKLLTIFVFILMLLFPKQVFAGASDGLLLWFNSVLPTLLPFMILSNLLLRTHAIDWIVRITGPVSRRVLETSDYGSFAAVTGFLCGYPMGSKVTADLLRDGKISLSEAQYLLSFCNNASPVFIISYIVLQNMRQERLLVPALVILMSSPILASFLFRIFYRHGRQNFYAVSVSENSGQTAGNIVDASIMNGFEMITKVGGYIMLFSILISLVETADISNYLIRNVLLPSMEITNGISLLCQSSLSAADTFFLCMVCTSFGGWCAAAQTSCMISGTGLSIKPYIVQKLIIATVTSLLCYIYFHFF